MLTHFFLYVPECPILLLGRDILHKLGATIHLIRNKLETGIPLDEGHKMITLMVEEKLPWSKSQGLGPGIGGLSCGSQFSDSMPKTGHTWPNRKQNLLHWEAFGGIVPLIQDLISQGLSRPRQSACNSTTAPIKKPNREYRLGQDLRTVTEATEYIHPVVPNPYTLLASLQSTWTCILY